MMIIVAKIKNQMTDHIGITEHNVKFLDSSVEITKYEVKILDSSNEIVQVEEKRVSDQRRKEQNEDKAYFIKVILIGLMLLLFLCWLSPGNGIIVL